MKTTLSLLLLAATACALQAAAPAVGSIAENRSFARNNGVNFTNTNLDAYEGKILVVMLMTPWCPICQSHSQAVGDGVLDFFENSTRGTLRGKNDRGVPIHSILLSTEEAAQWDSVNESFSTTNGYKQWGLDANAQRGNPRTMLGYFRGGFINSANLYDWGNDRRRVVILNLVRNSGSHSYREIVLNRNTYSSSDNASTRAAINAIRPAAVITAPNITSNPASVTINSGGTATLSVTASGTTPTFQWYVGASGVTTSLVSGATSATYTTPMLSSSRTYWVRASNASGSDDSTAATVTVNPPPPVTNSFSQWRSTYVFPSGKSGPNDDPDGDGIPNLLEFFHGVQPLLANSGQPLVTLRNNAGSLVLIYQRAKNPAGLTVDHQFTDDFILWTDLPDHTLGIATTDQGTTEEVTVTLPANSEPKAYYRVKVTAS